MNIYIYIYVYHTSRRSFALLLFPVPTTYTPSRPVPTTYTPSRLLLLFPVPIMYAPSCLLLLFAVPIMYAPSCLLLLFAVPTMYTSSLSKRLRHAGFMIQTLTGTHQLALAL